MIDNKPPNSPESAYFAIIVAGGSGSRMKSDVSKQFMLLHGKPILQHTIERFLSVRLPVSLLAGPVSSLAPVVTQTTTQAIHIILVLPARDLLIWQALCDQHNFHPLIQTVTGGATRFQSVRNGLNAVPDGGGLVAVHDGVRPFVSAEIIQNGFETAARTGSAVTSVPVKDSVRIVNENGSSQAVDRSLYRLIQTPQIFQLQAFRQAFQTEEQPFFTDCASVMDYAGFPITLIEGSYENIKITTPEDLK